MQGALYDTFIDPSFQVKAEHHTHLAAMLSHAELERLLIAPGAPAAGKFLSELQLRTHSGASAVAIERGTESIINPGPEEEIRPGDVLLLIGTEQQIERARRLLCGDMASA
jgi:K+/H+ antiporter YhaU regulatory subunit KhtT